MNIQLTLSFPETSASSDSPVDDNQQYGDNYYDPTVARRGVEYDDDLGVQCPSHSTYISEIILALYAPKPDRSRKILRELDLPSATET